MGTGRERERGREREGGREGERERGRERERELMINEIERTKGRFGRGSLRGSTKKRERLVDYAREGVPQKERAS
jgi:hypothetical protein